MKLSRKAVVSLTAAICGLGWVATASAASVDQAVLDSLANASKTRVIINLKQPAAAADGWAAVQEDGLGAEAEAQIAGLQAGVLASAGSELDVIYQYQSVSAIAGEVTAEGLSRLASLPEVESVVEDREHGLYLNEARPLIGAHLAHSAGYRGQGAEVAILDTGIDRNHPDLADDLVAQKCFESVHNTCQGSASSNNAEDIQGHGTHVAGIVTGKGTYRKGIAPDANVTMVRVFSSVDVKARDSDIIAGLSYVKNSRPFAAVVNMSLGGGAYAGTCDTANSAMTSIMSQLKARGTAIFVSSGNDRRKTQIGYPSCISHAYAVGAVYDANVGGVGWSSCSDASTWADKPTCFSNWSPQVQIMGPGALIQAAKWNGTWTTKGGTSMSSPAVAAVAALMRSKNGTLPPATVLTKMKSTGKWVQDPLNAKWNKRVEAKKAVDATAKGLKPGWNWVKCRYFNRTENTGYSWCYADGIGWVYDFDNLIESAFLNATSGSKWIALYVNNLSGNISAVQMQY